MDDSDLEDSDQDEPDDDDASVKTEFPDFIEYDNTEFDYLGDDEKINTMPTYQQDYKWNIHDLEALAHILGPVPVDKFQRRVSAFSDWRNKRCNIHSLDDVIAPHTCPVAGSNGQFRDIITDTCKNHGSPFNLWAKEWNEAVPNLTLVPHQLKDLRRLDGCGVEVRVIS